MEVQTGKKSCIGKTMTEMVSSAQTSKIQHKVKLSIGQVDEEWS